MNVLVVSVIKITSLPQDCFKEHFKLSPSTGYSSSVPTKCNILSLLVSYSKNFRLLESEKTTSEARDMT